MKMAAMRHVSLAVLVALVLYPPAFAQNNAREGLLQDLRQTMSMLAAARAAAAGDAWSRYVTDEFVVIHSDGRIHHRVEEIAELNAAKPSAVLVRQAERFHWYADHTVVYSSDFIGVSQAYRVIEFDRLLVGPTRIRNCRRRLFG